MRVAATARWRRTTAGFTLGAMLCMGSQAAAGQSRRPAPKTQAKPARTPVPEPLQLASLKHLQCKFPVVALAAWSAGAPAAPRVKTDVVLAFHLYAIDTQGGSAHLVGGPTAPDVFVVTQSTPWGLHFIENESTGTISLTSVFEPPSAGGVFRAVHARSSYLPVALPGFPADPTIAQYSGECKPAP